MKFLFIITFISFFTLNVSAQTVAMAPINSNAKTTKDLDKELLTKRHTRAATQQIHVHLQKNLIYTQKMQEQLIEGEFEVIVMLNPNGKIVQVKMGENQSPIVNHAVKEAMAKMNKILYRGTHYAGASEIRVPIKLSVR